VRTVWYKISGACFLESHDNSHQKGSASGSSTLGMNGRTSARRLGRRISALGLIERRSRRDQDNISALIQWAVTAFVNQLNGGGGVVGCALEGRKIEWQARHAWVVNLDRVGGCGSSSGEVSRTGVVAKDNADLDIGGSVMAVDRDKSLG
jgi:hypothetical protein